MLQFKLAKRCHSSFLHPSKFSTSSSLEFVSPDLLKLITKCFCFFPLCSSWLPSTLQPKRSFFFHSNAKKEGKENKNPKIRKTSVYLMFFKILCLIWNQGSNNKSSSCLSFQWGLRDFSRFMHKYSAPSSIIIKQYSKRIFWIRVFTILNYFLNHTFFWSKTFEGHYNCHEKQY